MKRAGRRITLVSLTLFILLICLFEAWVYFRDVVHLEAVAQIVVRFVFGVIPFAAVAIFVGAALWLAGWIIEGFAKNNPS
jgi:hypothetical protein